jgi:hypothetical protein
MRAGAIETAALPPGVLVRTGENRRRSYSAKPKRLLNQEGLMSTSDLSHPAARQAVVEATQALFANGVMSHSGHANLSARVDDDKLLLTVQGQVRDLGPDRLALVGLDRTVLEGELDPANAEIVAMHAEVYRARPQVGGIIHTHSPHLLAFAMANRPLPCRYEALLRFGQATAGWALLSPGPVSPALDAAQLGDRGFEGLVTVPFGNGDAQALVAPFERVALQQP